MSTGSRIESLNHASLVSSSIRVSVETRDDTVVVVKTFPEHRWQSAAAEAEWLRSAAGVEGVAALVTSDRATISTLHAGGTTLRSSPPAPGDAAVLLAQVAGTLGELEDLKLCHGAINPDHVVVGGGRAVLCSPRSEASEENGDLQGDDLQGLGRCCSYLLGEWHRTSVHVPRLEDWTQLSERMVSGDPTLSPSRVQAQLLGLSAVTGRSHLRAGRRQPGRILRMVAVAAVTAMVAAGLWIYRLTSFGEAGITPSGPQVFVNDKLFQVGRRPGVAVVLEPLCSGQPAVVLLDDQGSVWSFATAQPDIQGVREAEVRGATQLAVTSHNGCGRISATGLAGEVQLQMFDP